MNSFFLVVIYLLQVRKFLFPYYPLNLSSSISRKFGSSSSHTILLTCRPGFLLGKKGHSLLRCPGFQQWKHNLFSMHCFLSSGVSFPTRTMSTSIALGSLVLEGMGVKGWYECWVGCWFLFEISSAHSHWVWKWMALKYHSWMVVGTVSMDMIRRMREGGIPVEKYPIRTFGSFILARVTWFWNSEMYWFREGE